MSTVKEKKSPPWILIGVFILFVGGGVYLVKTILSEDAPRRKDTTATVTLLKPPPPPVIREKPPEPEPVKEMKKEEIIDPGVKNESPQNDNQDDTPTGNDLGVDAEGGAGSDGFGLVGKKGGRSILAGGGGFGKGSLLAKFSGYTQVVTTELRKKVMKRLDEEGGIPRGKLQAVVRVTVDSDGRVSDYRIIGSSGNSRMDEAIIQSLRSFRASEAPPEGMPKTMDIRIASQG